MPVTGGCADHGVQARAKNKHLDILFTTYLSTLARPESSKPDSIGGLEVLIWAESQEMRFTFGNRAITIEFGHCPLAGRRIVSKRGLQ
jgi:hypothetical protein